MLRRARTHRGLAWAVSAGWRDEHERIRGEAWRPDWDSSSTWIATSCHLASAADLADDGIVVVVVVARLTLLVVVVGGYT